VTHPGSRCADLHIVVRILGAVLTRASMKLTSLVVVILSFVIYLTRLGDLQDATIVTSLAVSPDSVSGGGSDLATDTAQGYVPRLDKTCSPARCFIWRCQYTAVLTLSPK
jgi:hypothetical protein